MTDYLFAFLMLATILYSIWMIRSQHRTIDRLNDRLMARDYREYVSTTRQSQTPETPRRRPKSWYDDPNIELDEESVN